MVQGGEACRGTVSEMLADPATVTNDQSDLIFLLAGLKRRGAG